MKIEQLLSVYNPWWEKGEEALQDVPEFERPVLSAIIRDIGALPQILSVTGPRRVGKTTLLRQLVRHFIRLGTPTQKLVYYSLDDPALYSPAIDRAQVVEALMRELLKRAEGDRVLLFLDEVQRLERWELFLKKYYDLSYPVRIVISGSASLPIFKKSRESLLGRVKDYHLLPFSLREFLLYKLRENKEFVDELAKIREQGRSLMGMLAGEPTHIDLKTVNLSGLSENLWNAAEPLFSDYVREGGFPEVWSLPTWGHKIDYLFDNQVKKVIYEDLVLAAEFRKPEQLKRFYLSLLERPGREINLSGIARETGIGLQQVEKYLPLLEMTDLVAHVQKFRKSPIRVRRGSMKFYLVDLALRNAVLRLQNDIITDAETMGPYAENLVFNALRKWPGTLALDYYRDRDGEVDFIVHLQPKQYLPVEVKYRDQIETSNLRPLRNFARRFMAGIPIVVAKRREDFAMRDGMFFVPLVHFLLLFD